MKGSILRHRRASIRGSHRRQVERGFCRSFHRSLLAVNYRS